MAALILFDDGWPLGPLTDLRGSFELRTGALTTAERQIRQLGVSPATLWVPPRLSRVVAGRYAVPTNRVPEEDAFLLLNGRWTAVEETLPTSADRALVDPDGAVLAARLRRENAVAFLQTGSLSEGVAVASVDGTAVLRRPWDILDRAAANLERDHATLGERLETLDPATATGVTVSGDHPVRVGPEAVVHPHVAFETAGGSVTIEDHAEIGPMSVLVGPTHVGAGSRVGPHAFLRGACVGPRCRVGGEVKATVFQGRSNKAHEGYVGDTFVGEWVNLGAGTVTSNLKNTGGEVRMAVEPDDPPQPTGRTHLGALVGDHVKTAVGTPLLTGSCLHTGSSLAASGFPPKTVERFAFLTDQGAERYAFEKFCRVASAAMGEAVGEPLRERLWALYEGESGDLGGIRQDRRGSDPGGP